MTLRIPIRIATIQGTNPREPTASCPLLVSEVGLVRCLVCEVCSGIVFEPATRAPFVVCGGGRVDDGGAVSQGRRSGDPIVAALATTPVSAVMTETSACLRADADLASLAAAFEADDACAIPVADAEGRMIGVVSRSDSNLHLAERSRSPGREGWTAGARDVVVGDLVTPLAHTVPETTPLGVATAMMAAAGAHALAVTRDGRVTGVVGVLDVLEWLAARAGYFDDPVSGRDAGAC